MSSTLLRSVRRVPLSGEDTEPVDVLVTDGIVAAVGHGLVADAPTVDYDGAWVAPGLWDAHTHFEQWAQAALRVDTAGTASPDAACRRVADHIATLYGPADSLVVGFGHRVSDWSRAATTAELDAVSGSHPVVLMAGDAHSGWLNTAAQQLLGVTFDGICAEADWFSLMPHLPQDTAALEGARRRRLTELAALGVTGVVDMVMDDHLGPWQTLAASGVALPRVVVGVFPSTLDEVVDAGLRTGDPLTADGLVRMGSLKIIADGSLSSLTAARRDGDGHVSGHFAYGLDELVALHTRARDHGLTVATHAIGDAALNRVLDAYETTGATGTVEHAQLVDRTEIARIVRLGLALSVQPWHLVDDWRAMDRLWADRTADAFPLRSLLDAGVPLLMGSDAPVAPLDPWRAMAAAVHRNTPDLPSWHPEEAITAAEAFRASVRTRVEAGQPADLVVLDNNPLAPQPDTATTARHLIGMSVLATYVAGARTR